MEKAVLTPQANSRKYCILLCLQLTLEGVALIINKSLKFSTWVQLQKWQLFLGRFQGKPFNITVIQVYPHTTDAEETEVEWFYEDIEELW